jgi:cell division protein YceG involved in septum cleavage
MLMTAFAGCMFGVHAQVQSGTLVDSGRKQVGAGSYTINGTVSGTVIVELSVNRKGEVASAKVIPEGTTLSSTPSIMKAQNAAKKLKFTPGTHYAEFEHVRVKYTYKKA